MDKQLQDLAWSVLPKEFKEEVNNIYQGLTAAYYKYAKLEAWDMTNAIYSKICILREVFGKHNLTSDPEGEEDEMLCVRRKQVQEEYRESIKKAHPYNINLYNRGFHVGCATTLKELFGSKCLPDELGNEVNFSTKDPKPSEPKFKRGDMVIYKLTGKKKVVLGIDKYGRYHVALPNMQSPMYVDESNLEPYTEPEETCTDDCPSQCKSQDFDRIVKDGFSKERRLNIAAMAMQGILSNPCGLAFDGKDQDKTTETVAEASFLFADALIAESEKGKEI